MKFNVFFAKKNVNLAIALSYQLHFYLGLSPRENQGLDLTPVTVSLKSGSGLNEVPAYDNTAEWARNPS